MRPRRGNEPPPSRSISVQQQRSESSEDRSYTSQDPYASHQSPSDSSNVNSTHVSTPTSGITFQQPFSQHPCHYPNEDFATQGTQLQQRDEQLSSLHSQTAQPMTQAYPRQPFEAYPSYNHNGSSHYYPQYQDVLPPSFEPRNDHTAMYKHHPTYNQESSHEHGVPGESRIDQSSYTFKSSLQPSPQYSQQPLYGPVYSMVDRQLPPPRSQVTQAPGQPNPTFFRGARALSPQRVETQRHNDQQHIMTPSFQQSLPIRQMPYKEPTADQTARPLHLNYALPIPMPAPQSPEIPERSAQSESPTATRRQNSRQGRRPQPVRSSSSSATQHVCADPGCTLADRPFSTFGNLQRHRREKHGIDPNRFACPRGCEKTFTRTTARENHLRNNRCKPPLPGRYFETGAGPSRRGGQC